MIFGLAALGALLAAFVWLGHAERKVADCEQAKAACECERVQ